jgi:CBS domain-containing protein
MAETLSMLATPIVVTANPETTAAQAARLMREHHVGSLVVVDAGTDSGRPLGILTDRDLVLAVMAEDLDPSLFTVGDLMSTDLAVATGDAGLMLAVTTLRERRLRRLIVVDELGRVTGLLTLEDLLDALATELGTLAQALRGARDREREQRR